MKGFVLVQSEDDYNNLQRRLDNMSRILDGLSSNQMRTSDVENVILKTLPGHLSNFVRDNEKVRELTENHIRAMKEASEKEIKKVASGEEAQKFLQAVVDAGHRKTDDLIKEKREQFDQVLKSHQAENQDLRTSVADLRSRVSSLERWNFWLAVGQIFTFSCGVVLVSSSWTKQ